MSEAPATPPANPSNTRPGWAKPMTDRTFLQRAWDAQHALERRVGAVKKGRYARVLRMARKPEPEEFRHTSNIVLVGIGIVGALGFVVLLVMKGLLRWFGA